MPKNTQTDLKELEEALNANFETLSPFLWHNLFMVLYKDRLTNKTHLEKLNFDLKLKMYQSQGKKFTVLGALF